jgi:hypothetical protein
MRCDEIEFKLHEPGTQTKGQNAERAAQIDNPGGGWTPYARSSVSWDKMQPPLEQALQHRGLLEA